jgi:uncharacterized Ntn-hydrolase superfamily protein
MTFSIAARCAGTGMLGIAVSSSSPAVAARCAFARAGIGAVATQNVTDPTLGPRALDLMALGASAAQALEVICGSALHIGYRQLAIVDAQGRTASFSGERTLGVHATAHGTNVVCAGNLLAGEGVPASMVAAFSTAPGHLGDRLLAAMQAAVAAGGEAGPVRSAGMLLVRDVAWPVADLRVDWADADPIGGLERLWQIYRPQLDAYVARALDPREAPSYGVPGDD